MNDLPRQKLRELIIEYGRSLCDDPRRCEALLKDYCGQYKREIFVLVSALKNRIAEDLLKVPAGIPQSMVLARLNKRLEDELAMTLEAAHWAVESWALALGVLDQSIPVVRPTRVSPPTIPTIPTIPKIAPTPQPPINESLVAGRYRDNGDGTVTDMQTGLQWMRFSLGQEWKSSICTGEAKKYTWQQTFDAANALNRQGGYAGCRDWRVPTKKQLQTLVFGQERLTIYQTTFPNTPATWFWSSSAEAGYPDHAWGINFGDGHVFAYLKGNYYHVRLVRTGS